MRDKKNLRRISEVVTAQTNFNLDRLAALRGYRDRGRIIDELVRDKMLEPKRRKRHEHE